MMNSRDHDSLVPDEIGQEMLADAHAGGPVVHQSDLSLKLEAKKINKSLTSSCPIMSGAL